MWLTKICNLDPSERTLLNRNTEFRSTGILKPKLLINTKCESNLMWIFRQYNPPKTVPDPRSVWSKCAQDFSWIDWERLWVYFPCIIQVQGHLKILSTVHFKWFLSWEINLQPYGLCRNDRFLKTFWAVNNELCHPPQHWLIQFPQ